VEGEEEEEERGGGEGSRRLESSLSDYSDLASPAPNPREVRERVRAQFRAEMEVADKRQGIDRGVDHNRDRGDNRGECTCCRNCRCGNRTRNHLPETKVNHAEARACHTETVACRPGTETRDRTSLKKMGI